MSNDKLTVYIVLVGNKNPHWGRDKVGAIYESEVDALAEVERLKKANSYTHVYYVDRELVLS